MDVRQSWDQVVHHQRSVRARADDLRVLGEEDPLIVAPRAELAQVVTRHAGRVDFCFAVDDFHTANSSGGETYHVRLPAPRADFEIVGRYEIDERLVEYLRATFSGGRLEVLEEDASRCRKVASKLAIVRPLAEALLLI